MIISAPESCPVNLAAFDNRWYHPGRPRLLQALWFFLGLPLLRSRLIPCSAPRRLLLSAFGARVGAGAVIKPGVRVKYPWLLAVGNHSWIGEETWIDNLAPVTIGDNVCVSQGAYLCTGNHDWSDPSFGLIVRPIALRHGAWVGARSLIGPGVTLGECAVAAAGSVVTRDIPPFHVHAGDTAGFTRIRPLPAMP